MKVFFHIPDSDSQAKAIVSKFNHLFETSEIDPYFLCQAFSEALKPYGYMFEYGLSGEPYNLRKLIQLDSSDVWKMTLAEINQCIISAEYALTYSDETWELLNLRMRSLERHAFMYDSLKEFLSDAYVIDFPQAYADGNSTIPVSFKVSDQAEEVLQRVLEIWARELTSSTSDPCNGFEGIEIVIFPNVENCGIEGDTDQLCIQFISDPLQTEMY